MKWDFGGMMRQCEGREVSKMEKEHGVPYEAELRVRVGEFEKISRICRRVSEEEKFAEDLRLQADKASEMLVACYRAILTRQHANDFIR